MFFQDFGLEFQVLWFGFEVFWLGRRDALLRLTLSRV